MKKIIYYLCLIIACLMLIDLVFPRFFSNKLEDRLINKAEDKLINSMNDPDSYEFVSFEEDCIYSDSIRKSDEEFNKEMNTNSNYNYYLLTYRGKNKLGALILDEVLVKCSDDIVIELIDVN